MSASREAHMMMMETPRMIDHFLHRFEERRHKGSSEDDAPESEESDE